MENYQKYIIVFAFVIGIVLFAKYMGILTVPAGEVGYKEAEWFGDDTLVYSHVSEDIIEDGWYIMRNIHGVDAEWIHPKKRVRLDIAGGPIQMFHLSMKQLGIRGYEMGSPCFTGAYCVKAESLSQEDIDKLYDVLKRQGYGVIKYYEYKNDPFYRYNFYNIQFFYSRYLGKSYMLDYLDIEKNSYCTVEGKTLDGKSFIYVGDVFYEAGTFKCRIGASGFKAKGDSGIVVIYLMKEKPECVDGDEKCEGKYNYVCENGKWVNKGLIKGKCGVECVEGEIRYHICPDGSKVEWCSCVNGEFSCIENPEKMCEISPPPVPTPIWKKIIVKILDWIIGLFDYFFAIAGPSVVSPGSIETYSIDLTAPIPDSDYSDGIYQIQMANWALVDRNGNIKEEGEWEEVKGNYVKNVNLKIPSEAGKYVLIAIIQQYDMEYNFDTSEWETVKEDVIAKEGIDIESKIPKPEPPVPIWSNIVELLKRIWDWFKNLF